MGQSGLIWKGGPRTEFEFPDGELGIVISFDTVYENEPFSTRVVFSSMFDFLISFSASGKKKFLVHPLTEKYRSSHFVET